MKKPKGKKEWEEQRERKVDGAQHFLHAHETERGEEAKQKRVRAAEKVRGKKKSEK